MALEGKDLRKTLSPMAKQAVAIASGNPLFLYGLHKSTGELQALITEFEHNRLPESVKIHSRKLELVVQGRKLVVKK